MMSLNTLAGAAAVSSLTTCWWFDCLFRAEADGV